MLCGQPGTLERGVRAAVVPDGKRATLHGYIHENVNHGATVYTDALASYNGLDMRYTHETLDHAVLYVDGQIHFNGIENFWFIVNRGLKGTYIRVKPFHLFRYLDERCSPSTSGV